MYVDKNFQEISLKMCFENPISTRNSMLPKQRSLSQVFVQSVRGET